MKLAVIADVHSNLPALKAVLKDIGSKEILSLGDVVGYNPFPKETIEVFMKRSIKGVRGNHDQAALDMNIGRFNQAAAKAVLWTSKTLDETKKNYLSSLPTTMKMGGVSAVHGSPRNPLYEYVYSEYPNDILKTFLGESQILLLAHTHVPFIKNVEGRLILNPGSVGQPRDGDPRASYALLDVDSKKAEIKRVEYDIEIVAEGIEKTNLPEWLAQRLYNGV